MKGIINSKLEPTLDLLLRGPTGEAQVSAVIDTGYDDYLSLPFNVISSFGLPRVRLQTVRLGDGSSRRAAIYMIEVDWDGQFKRIEALCMPGDPVIGTALLKGYKLDADFISGGSVQVTRL